MADNEAGTGRFGRRGFSWRWCLAGGGALFILLGVAMGIPNSAAGTGHPRREASAPHNPRHHSDRRHPRVQHRAGGTTTTANPATGLGAPLPPGASDGTSVATAQPVPTTLPPVQSLAAGDTPPAQSVPLTTTSALLLIAIGLGAFGAGWTIGRRRAIPQP